MDIVRRLFAIKGVNIGIDAVDNDLAMEGHPHYNRSLEYLELLESVDCLVSYNTQDEYRGKDSNPLHHRLFELLYKHRATMTHIRIGTHYSGLLQRWLHTLDDFPVATCNIIHSIKIPESDLQLFYGKLSNGTNVLSQTTHNIFTATDAHHFIEYLDRPCSRNIQSYETTVILYHPQVLQHLFQCRHITTLSLIFCDQDVDTATPIDINLASNIQRLIIHSYVSVFSLISLQRLCAPNLMELDLNYKYRNDQELSDLTTLINGGVPNLVKLSIKIPHGKIRNTTLSRVAIKSLLDAISSHPTLQQLDIQHIDHVDLLIQAIRNN
eukprot:gene12269-14381_t